MFISIYINRYLYKHIVVYISHLLINNIIRPSLLTKTELDWLLGNIQVSGNYNHKIKSQFRKKINNFENLELPLLIEKGLISFSPVTKFSNGVTKNSSVDTHSSSSNSETCAQIKSLERDLNARFESDSSIGS